MNITRKVYPRLQWMFAATIICLIFVVFGCSPIHRFDATSVDARADASADANDLPHAIQYAKAWRKQLTDNVVRNARKRSALTLGLVPVFTSLAYIGVNGGDTERFSSITAVGATAYGIGVLSTNSEIDEINLKGVQAINCAIAGAAPLDMSGVRGFELLAMSTNKPNHLRNRIQNLNNDLSATRKNCSDISDDTAEIFSEICDEITMNTHNSVKFAQEVMDYGSNLELDIKSAASNLRVSVDQIIAEVNLQIAARLPSPDKILSVAKSVGADGSVFNAYTPLQSESQKLPSPKIPEKPTTVDVENRIAAEGKKPSQINFRNFAVQPDKFIENLNNVNENAESVYNDSKAILQFVKNFDGKKLNLQGKGSCNLGKISSSFSVFPVDDSIVMPANGTYKFVVQSAAGIPTAKFVGSEPKNFTLEMRIENNVYVVVVKTTENATNTDSAQLLIAGATGGSKKLITLKVAE